MSRTVHKLAALAAALVATASATAAFAQATDYTLNVGGNYTSLNNAAAAPCDIGPCHEFTSSERMTGSFRLNAPLAPNLAASNLAAADVTSYSFSNGVTTFDSTDPNVRLNQIQVSTDGAGVVTSFAIWLNRWNVLPHAPGDGANGRLGYMSVTEWNQYAQHNMTCDAVGTAPSGTTDACTSNSAGTDTTSATAATINTLTAATVAPAPVPTLSEWAMILLGLMLAGGAALHIQRRSLMG